MWSYLLAVLTPKVRGKVIVAWHDRAAALYRQFERDGDRNAAEQAMRLFRRMAGIGSPGDPYRIAALNNLSGALHDRFTGTGDLADLDEAIVLGRAAVEASPDGDVNRSTYRSNLCHTLRLRFKHTGNLADLDEAIALGRSTGHGRRTVHRPGYGGAPPDHWRSCPCTRREYLTAPGGRRSTGWFPHTPPA
jgi:hypothetical protein